VQTNAARYLPADTLRVLIVHNITPGTYGAARAVRDHVHAAVGVSERCRADLVAHYGFDPRRTLAIPNAVEIGAPGARPERRAGGLRLIFLGRVEDSSKGVMWLPSILKHLPADTALTVAGDGPDWARLADKLKPFGARVTMLGAVSPGRVRELMTSHDMFVMPSRFEGFGIALVEAMAGGCVPVASLIHGVTDTIVTDGTDGILVPVGDWRAAAREIEALWLYPERLAALSRAAMRRAEGAFPISAMAERYAALIADLAADPPVIAAPLPLETWALPRGLRDGFRTYLPGPVKNGLRVVKERLQGVRARSGRLTASSAE
jgi:glycosyltransferase involved in cell wall biosynthesis